MSRSVSPDLARPKRVVANSASSGSMVPTLNRTPERRAAGVPAIIPRVDLRDALRTTGAVREFTGEPVSDAVLYDILDTARFAPSGGNRQGWRTIVVRDPGLRRGLRYLYLPGRDHYPAMRGA